MLDPRLCHLSFFRWSVGRSVEFGCRRRQFYRFSGAVIYGSSADSGECHEHDCPVDSGGGERWRLTQPVERAPADDGPAVDGQPDWRGGWGNSAFENSGTYFYASAAVAHPGRDIVICFWQETGGLARLSH